MKYYISKKLNLQLFAEGEGDGATSNGSGSDANSEETGLEGEGGSETNFDDFLSDPRNQAEFDRRVAKALNTQKSRLDDEYKVSLADAKKEAEKLAKMNEEQKKQYEAEKKDELIKSQQAEIDNLKREALKAELSKQAARIMKSDHKIVATQDMLDFVVADDSETTNANIKKLVGIILDDRRQIEEARAIGRTPRSYENIETISEIQKRINKYK